MTRVAVVQSNYMPWKGYFDLIHDVDLFVFHDDLRYTKGDWRNRNRIKTSAGVRWLTVPVGQRQDRLICDVEIREQAWRRRHRRRLLESYREAPFRAWLEPFFDEVYGRRWERLSELNQWLVREIAARFLGIRTELVDSRRFAARGTKQERLFDLLRRVGARTYVSGPAARAYIDPERFADAGIELVWKDYSGYPLYAQPHPPFVHEVSILDVLLQNGDRAADCIWGWRDPAAETTAAAGVVSSQRASAADEAGP